MHKPPNTRPTTDPFLSRKQRFATGRWNNATAVALLQIETIEKGTSQQRTVGYVVFPFFVDPETNEPPATSMARGYRLKEGGWQVPVRIGPFPNPASLFSHTRPAKGLVPLTVYAYTLRDTDTLFYWYQVYAATATQSGSGFSLKEVLSRPKIPCASVLVRALVATRAGTYFSLSTFRRLFTALYGVRNVYQYSEYD